MASFVLLLVAASCNKDEDKHPYQDLIHYSKTFGREKTYRIYLPQSYDRQDTARYPVIYFFHGWGGRHGSDDNARLAYDSLQLLVDKYQALLVMWDGNIDEKEPRPYNVGSHSDIRYETQMKDYFPELINHIDSSYRTRNDKWSRGIIGFSMGGFMSYFLAGKYPGKIGAAVDMTGSPEFFVGYPDRHTLYPLRYTFENLRNVRLRFHNSTADELTYLNTEVKEGAGWDDEVSFDYWQFEGGHMVDLPGETKVFEKAIAFVTDAFQHPLPYPEAWTHHDVYPSFEVYGYKVTSDVKRPGFISLKHVSPAGFGVETKKWLPDGPAIDSVRLQITTAPLYPPNAMMHVVKYRHAGSVVAESNVKADKTGRLHFLLDGAGYELGIYPAGSPFAGVIAVDYQMADKRRMLRRGINALRLLLLNRGSIQHPTTVRLICADSNVSISPSTLTLTAGKRLFETNLVTIRCQKSAPRNGAPPFVRLRIETAIAGENNVNEFVLPVMFDSPLFSNVMVDDNRKVNDSTIARGWGNGDGIVDPGERVVFYVDGHPLQVQSDDVNLVAEKEDIFDIMVPAKWPDGITLASVVKVADDCPAGADITLSGSYETKEFMPIKRELHWGTVQVKVGKPLQ